MGSSFNVGNGSPSLLKYKQNRESTEGCSKSIVRKNTDKFGKRIDLNKWNICKSKIGRDKVSRGVSVPCSHTTSVTYALRKKLFCNNFKCDKNITNWYNVFNIECYWCQHVEHTQIQKGQDQVSEGVSVACRHATPVASVLWKPLILAIG